jgi:hypothetical protein
MEGYRYPIAKVRKKPMAAPRPISSTSLTSHDVWLQEVHRSGLEEEVVVVS